MTFIQRFGKALNPHFHFHSCIIDGVFDKEGKFYPIAALTPEEIYSVQERIRKRVLRLFRKKGLLDSDVASDMLDWDRCLKEEQIGRSERLYFEVGTVHL